jgi:NlpC/P60 family putative phage cell wall peptidase
MTRPDIVAAARDWIATPYRHQASLKGVGADCLGLLRGVWRECLGPEPETLPAYTPDWAERLGEETLLAGARRHLPEIAIGASRPGDVLVFRIVQGCPAKHCAILSAPAIGADPGRIIHAYWGRAVCETRLVAWWQRRIAGAFAFPGLED